MPSYIPQTDAGLEAWALNFSTLLTAAPTTYGLTSGNATTVASVYSAWHTAYLAAVDKPSRTQIQVQAKNTAKANLLAVVRPFAQQIRANASVSDADKVAVGVTVPGGSPTPIPAPTSRPLLTIQQGNSLSHTLRYADEATPDKRSKPFGAQLIEIRVVLGTSVSADPSAGNVVTQKGRQPVIVNYDSADRGKVATYFARWISRKGDTGPFSAPVAMAVP
jgi:hypothetical protein